MHDRHDPIMDSTPAKRRKLNSATSAKVWDSDNDSGDNLDEGDFEAATIPRHVTQPTQPLPTQAAWPKSPEVQVDRSSPVLIESSPPRATPAPIRRAPFAKPGVLASAMAPPGTSFRVPPGVQARPATIDLDSDEDPPVHHSDDEATQSLHSNLKPANFQKSGRGSISSPDASKARAGPNTDFMSLLSEFSYKPPPPKPADDLISAYSNSSRGSRPSKQPQQPQKRYMPAPAPSTAMHSSLDDITDLKTRAKVEKMQDIVGEMCTIQQCIDALRARHGSVEDALDWLAQQQEAEQLLDELAPTPVKKKGIAQPTNASQTAAQPVRPAAKQEIRAPARTIAEKWSSTQRVAAQGRDSDEDAVKPRRRLVQGRKATSRSTPPSSPQKPVIEIDSGSESDSGLGRDSEEPQGHDDTRLLKFFNDCSAGDLSELCGQTEENANFVLSKRPFRSLDQVRSITKPTATKKASRARPIGDKVVDDCLEMLTGYNAVDELVKQCEKIAVPLQKALKSWGVGDAGSDGELHLMKLDEAHDSGIGTPTSSCPPDEPPSSSLQQRLKGKFITQPKNMSSDLALKDYQLVGVNWLNLLYEKRLSCILADDMGLGKTCQIIAFLSYLQLKKVDGVHLIIVPGSTLENWLREFERFAPQLTVRPYYAAQKEREQLRYELEEQFDELDVIITTYEMAAAKDDNKFLRRYGPFSVCVYDEAHALRNPKSNRYQQLVRIGADFKVLLTGTPLQNNLQELIAILAFIMPALFQDKRDDLEVIFKHKATTNDATHAAMLSSERIARARSMMTPFILRRKKEQVLDLPAKHRRVEYCDMTEAQAEFYAEVLGEARQFYNDPATRTSKSGASANVLMALRKVANHPLLSRRIYDPKKIDKIVTVLSKSDEFGENPVDKIRAYITGEAGISLQGGDFAIHCFCAERRNLAKFALKRQEWMEAGKVKLFKELISRFASNGDRVLVFSQFTTVMDILEAVLETLEIKFMRLDGSTKMDLRQDMIDQFSTDASIPVFMLSTKAGGAGINLAAANKVIIFDSGFNPQDDIQAENRAHRVGQTREVEVIRMVTRGTIEEQIHALGESKLALDERVAGEGASAAEDKQAEKAGEQLVQKMLVDDLQKSEQTQSGDLKDMFKKGLEGKGLQVMSKQAQF